MITVNDISSIGWLHNHDGSICLTLAIISQNQPVFVSIPKAEFDGVGGMDGLNANKQLGVDFYHEYGVGRSLAKPMLKCTSESVGYDAPFRKALELAKEQALADPATYLAHPQNGHVLIAEQISWLGAECAATCSAINPAFKGIPEMAQRLVVLWGQHPDHYAVLMSGLDDSVGGLGSLKGLVAAQNLINGLADDGEYYLDQASEDSVIRRMPVPGSYALTPATMVEVLKNLDASLQHASTESLFGM